VRFRILFDRYYDATKKRICTSLHRGFNFAKSFESSLLEAKEPSRLSTEHYPLKTSSAYAVMTFLNGEPYKKSRRKKLS